MLRVIGIGQSLAEVLVAEDAAAVVGRSSAFTGHETGVGSPVDGLGDCLQGEHMEPAVAEVVGVLELIALGPQHLVQRDLCSGCVSSPAWICPEGAACMAAARQLRESGWIGEGERVVVLNTGTGLNYPETVSIEVPVLARDGRVPTVA